MGDHGKHVSYLSMYVYGQHQCHVGISGQVFSGLPARRNAIEIMATVVGFPEVRTVVTSNVDLTGQGK